MPTSRTSLSSFVCFLSETLLPSCQSEKPLDFFLLLQQTCPLYLNVMAWDDAPRALRLALSLLLGSFTIGRLRPFLSPRCPVASPTPACLLACSLPLRRELLLAAAASRKSGEISRDSTVGLLSLPPGSSTYSETSCS